jgi:hypothetical protein
LEFGNLLVLEVLPLAVRIFVLYLPEAVAVDAGFDGEGAVEAPLSGGDAQDELLFALADGVEAVVEVFQEEEEVFGILAGQEVLVGAEAVFQAIAAGCGFAFGGAWASGFFGVLTVGVDLAFRGCTGGVRFVHIRISAYMLRGRIWGIRTQFS